MSYCYETMKFSILTDEGQRVFLKVRDKAFQLLDDAGAFKMFKPLKDITGVADTDTMMAYIDRLVELGEIVEVTKGMGVAGQDRVFIKAL